MSVQPGPTFKRYAANGVATVYTIPFLLLAATDLQITLNGVLVTNGFTLAGIGNPQSSCTFSVPPAGDLLFQMVMPFQRLTDYQMNGDFQSSTVNPDFDRLWLAVKQLSRDSNLALTVSLLEPEGIPSLPVKAARALKMLAFDSDGNPITSNLTMAQLEQQPALALEAAEQAAASALAAGEAAAVSTDAKNASVSAAAASAASAQSVVNGAVQLGMSAWGYRAQPFAGHALDDGQELDRAVYPDFAAALDAGLLPTVTQAQWNADPANRACFVANSSAGKFRMRDRNGVSPGSLGAAFERGGSGAVLIKQDQIQNITATLAGDIPTANPNITPSGAFGMSPIPSSAAGSAGTNFGLRNLTFDASRVVRTGTETFPTHAAGAWMTKLFGVITALGSAEAASLATAYASLASRISALEFGYISTNQTWGIGGTITLNHGLAARPVRTSVEAECTTADAGYAVGSVVDLGTHQCLVSGANNFGFSTEISATQLIMNIAAQGLAIANKSTRAVVAMTPASWRLRLKAGKS
ncbi:hypothetical protein [Pseudomonas sp. WS 5410]|uniref:hypothetical protein n=1 Tax=Pseudomonas sp. WS 5410 TaxID=2717485 RepID=UPI001476192A|nr:hypothetical protein [Pseudomonas sp. WS 5410]NMY20838.1 hypothetical protein [Pseudomonas sp. WS 5410]